MARETDLIKQKNESEIFLRKILEENTNSNSALVEPVIETPLEARTSFRNIPHEEFHLNQLLTLLIKILLMLWLIFGRFAKPLEHGELNITNTCSLSLSLKVYNEVTYDILSDKNIFN